MTAVFRMLVLAAAVALCGAATAEPLVAPQVLISDERQTGPALLTPEPQLRDPNPAQRLNEQAVRLPDIPARGREENRSL